MIARTVSALPLHVPDADREAAERTMAEAARGMDARTLTRVAARVRAWLDQDGAAPTDRELAEPVNELHLSTRANGRTVFRGELDQEASALFTARAEPAGEATPERRHRPGPA